MKWAVYTVYSNVQGAKECTTVPAERNYVHEKEERHLGSVDDQQATIQKVPVLPKDRRRLSACCTRERRSSALYDYIGRQLDREAFK